MAKPPLTLANAYTLIVESGNIANDAAKWRNTWDIFATVEPQPTDGIIDAIVNFHLSNLRTDAGVFLLTLRNWSQGPQPFANRSFLWEDSLGGTAGLKTSAPPDGYGSQAAGANNIPREAVLFAKRTTSSGAKSTNMFMRGILDNADIGAETGGKWGMFPGAAVTAAKFEEITQARLVNYLGSGKDPGLVIVHVGNHGVGPAFSSPITDVQFRGVSVNKATRKNKR